MQESVQQSVPTVQAVPACLQTPRGAAQALPTQLAEQQSALFVQA